MKTEYKSSPARRAYANAYYDAMKRTASRSVARREACAASQEVRITKPNGNPASLSTDGMTGGTITLTLPINVVGAYITNLLKREVGVAPQGD